MTAPLSDRRAAATAGALVAAVVIILGFGSGIGAVLSRSGGQASASPAGGHDRGTVVQDSSTEPVTASAAPSPRAAALTTARSSGSYPQPIAGDDVAAADSMAMTLDGSDAASQPAWGSTSSDATSDASTTSTGSATSACRGSSLAAAMVEPLWMHFTKAHLETSPGQQAHDALNVDTYIKIHTVLLEDMVAPAVDTVLASITGVTPFWMHFKTAHLETSPGDQVASAANLDQYTKTHTVLIENMAAPAMHDVADYGCP